MSDGDAQLDRDADHAYSEREAKDAFTRMVAKYGWNKWQSPLDIYWLIYSKLGASDSIMTADSVCAL